MEKEKKEKILIVGAGPVGLAAALFLCDTHPELQIIQKNTGLNRYSKAFLVNTRTLSLLSTIGVDQDIINEGI